MESPSSVSEHFYSRLTGDYRFSTNNEKKYLHANNAVLFFRLCELWNIWIIGSQSIVQFTKNFSLQQALAINFNITKHFHCFPWNYELFYLANKRAAHFSFLLNLFRDVMIRMMHQRICLIQHQLDVSVARLRHKAYKVQK